MRGIRRDYVLDLNRLGADPTQPIHVLTAELRRAGVQGGDREMRAAIRAYRDQRTPPDEGTRWVSRTAAAQMLGVSVKRVDQLRRLDRLVWRRAPYLVRSVQISVMSISRLVALRRAQLATRRVRATR